MEKQNNSSNTESYNKTIILTEAVIFTQTIYQTTEALKCYIFFLKHKSLQNIGQLITHSLQSKKSCSKDTFKITFIISRWNERTSFNIDVAYLKYQEPLKEYSYQLAQ